MKETGFITIHHGSGKKQSELLDFIVDCLGAMVMSIENDGGFINEVVDAISTDSFTISPAFFPGGDIGKLAIVGSINDVVMLGAEPLYLTLSLIIEEGFQISELEKILTSARGELESSGTRVICGDTKVVNRRAVDRIVINTACLGRTTEMRLTADKIETGDQVVITGPVGLHGASVMAARNGFEIDFVSDCRALTPLLKAIGGLDVHAMRDPTRGGLAQILNELSRSTRRGILLEERLLPCHAGVAAVADILGVDPLYLACEGTAVIFCEKGDSPVLVERLKFHGFSPALIGEVGSENIRPLLVIRTRSGAERVLPMLIEELTPRIC